MVRKKLDKIDRKPSHASIRGEIHVANHRNPTMTMSQAQKLKQRIVAGYNSSNASWTTYVSKHVGVVRQHNRYRLIFKP
jgi:hypothetical protein